MPSVEKTATKWPLEYTQGYDLSAIGLRKTSLKTKYSLLTSGHSSISRPFNHDQESYKVPSLCSCGFSGALLLGNSPAWDGTVPRLHPRLTPPLPAVKGLGKHAPKEKSSTEIQRIQLCCCPTSTPLHEQQGEAMPRETRGHPLPCPSTQCTAGGKKGLFLLSCLSKLIIIFPPHP